MKIFLSTHRKMASGMRSSLEILTGNTDKITVFDAYLPGSTESINEKIEKFFSSCREDETKILISDFYGGSANQVLARYSLKEKTFLITGINLALLLELSVVEKEYDEKDFLELITQAWEGMRLIKFNLNEEDNEVFYKEAYEITDCSRYCRYGNYIENG